MVVWVTELPLKSVAVARNETNPVMLGCVTVAVRFTPDPVTVAFCQVAPSLVEYCTVIVLIPATGEPVWATAVSGMGNEPAGATLSAFSAGLNVTAHSGNRSTLFGSTSEELNDQTAPIWVPSTVGAPRDTVVS